jgi:hypothetical protein
MLAKRLDAGRQRIAIGFDCLGWQVQERQRRSSEQHLEPDKDERGRREHDKQAGARQFLLRRQPGALALDEFEIVANCAQVGAGLIDLSQG